MNKMTLIVGAFALAMCGCTTKNPFAAAKNPFAAAENMVQNAAKSPIVKIAGKYDPRVQAALDLMYPQPADPYASSVEQVEQSDATGHVIVYPVSERGVKIRSTTYNSPAEYRAAMQDRSSPAPAAPVVAPAAASPTNQPASGTGPAASLPAATNSTPASIGAALKELGK